MGFYSSFAFLHDLKKKGAMVTVLALSEQVEEDYDFDRWMEKWQFVLRNHPKPSQELANIALAELDKTISYGIGKDTRRFAE